MNILLFSSADEIAPGRICIGGKRREHLLQVLKLERGQTIRVGERNGQLGLGTVQEINNKHVILTVELSDEPPAKLPLSVILALPRPKMLRRILRAVAEFGVAELHLINSYRVEKSYWKTPALEPSTVEEYFVKGLEQSRDTVLPTLHLHQRFKPFVEDELPDFLHNKRALLAHPGEYPLCPFNVSENVVLVIGPEGGFIPYEVEKLQQAGCETVSLGSRILRVENALTSLIGRLF